MLFFFFIRKALHSSVTQADSVRSLGGQGHLMLLGPCGSLDCPACPIPHLSQTGTGLKWWHPEIALLAWSVHHSSLPVLHYITLHGHGVCWRGGSCKGGQSILLSGSCKGMQLSSLLLLPWWHSFQKGECGWTGGWADCPLHTVSPHFWCSDKTPDPRTQDASRSLDNEFSIHFFLSEVYWGNIG